MSLLTVVFWTLLSLSVPQTSQLPDGWIDRVEGDIAVLIVTTDSVVFREMPLPLAVLPPGAQEGDWIIDGRVDYEQREQVMQRVLGLQRQLGR